MIFGIKEKSIILNPYFFVLLAIATDISQRPKTGFVLQGHIFYITYIGFQNLSIFIMHAAFMSDYLEYLCF